MKKKSIFVLLLIPIILFTKIEQSKDIEIVKNPIKISNPKTIKVIGNNNVKGSLKLPNKNSEYIMQGDDNEYYLNHNYNNEELKRGSIVLDYRNNVNDKLLILYGHNSKDIDTYFNSLENYLDYDYYHNYPEIEIELNNLKYKYKVFSVMSVDKNNNQHTKINFDTNNEYLEQLKYLKNNSLYDTKIDVDTSDYVIILQTCNMTDTSKFILVNLKREK